ncbi:MAG: hypothetical protein IJF67_05295 [Clostridia bacterium]|nr:hypothetical protein [Clostridia bacterium]
MTIEDYISRELSGTDRQTALDFVRFLREKELHFHRDTCDCWKDKIYYWVQHGDDCVCFIAIADPDEPANRWTVWSDDMDGAGLAEVQEEPAICEAAWCHVDHCGHCGSCGGGRRKIIFGRTFEDVCGCTFRVDNPSPGDLPFLKEVVELRLAEIAQ